MPGRAVVRGFAAERTQAPRRHAALEAAASGRRRCEERGSVECAVLADAAEPLTTARGAPNLEVQMVPVRNRVQCQSKSPLRLPAPERTDAEQNHVALSKRGIHHRGFIVQLISIRKQARHEK